jgi:hypothetical protein
MYSPFELNVKMLPPAPKYEHEITEILEEGLKSDTGAMLVEAFGRKDGKDVRVDTYVYAPAHTNNFSILQSISGQFCLYSYNHDA